MDRGNASVLREFCPILLCKWSDDRAIEFVNKCSNMNEIEICWLWDWFLMQIKGNDPPSSNISLIIANFLLKRLPKSHKLPPFVPLKLITIHDVSNIRQVSNVIMEIANRNPSTAPSLLVKRLNEILLLKYDPNHSELVSALSYLLLKSLYKYNPKASYKAIESILLCEIEILEKYFQIDNFLRIILFSVSNPFHKTMSTFYITENYLKCLNLSKEMNISTVDTHQHSIFYHLINWSDHLSSRNTSYLFYKIHEYYLDSFDTNDSKIESDRDKLCFSTFVISLFCRNINSHSIDLFESLYLILSKSNEAGLFSFVLLDNEPLHIIKSIKLPFKLFNLLLQLAENIKDDEVCKYLWKNIKLLFDLNLHQIDLKYFISLISKRFIITQEVFHSNFCDSLRYILDSPDNEIQQSDNVYLDTLTNLISSLYRLGDLHTFFENLSDMQFYFILSPNVLKVIHSCADESSDDKVFESLIKLLDRCRDGNLIIALRIFISCFLLSINIRDNLPCKKFVSSFSDFINRYVVQDLSGDDLADTSLYLFILSIFVAIRKIESCFTYTSNFTPYNVRSLTNLLFNPKVFNIKSDLALYQLRLYSLSLIHTSLYYATRMFNNKDIWAIGPITNLSQTIYKAALGLSEVEVKRFYLLYISNPHLLEIYGIKPPSNLVFLSQILNENPDLPLNPTVITSLVGDELSEILEPSRLKNINIHGLSRVLSCFDNPTNTVLDKIIHCLDMTDCEIKAILLGVVERLSEKKSLHRKFASHFINELIYPLESHICTSCKVKCQELDSIKSSLDGCNSRLFTHLKDDLCHLLIERSLGYIIKTHFQSRDTSCDDFMVFITYHVLKRTCNFELPIHLPTDCTYCGIYNKRKDVFLHLINTMDVKCTLFKNLQKYKKLDKYVSLLICGSMRLENTIISIKSYINRNISNESLELCIAFIRLIAMDKTRQINQQVYLELLAMSKEFNLSMESVVSLGETVGSPESLIEYLELVKNDVIKFESAVYSVIKHVMQADHLGVGEALLVSTNNRFPPINSENVILILFVCDSVLKASRGIYNPSSKIKGDLFSLIIDSFKIAIEFIKNNDKFNLSVEIYVYACKIACSLYYRMKKSALDTIGYINVNNHLLISDVLVCLSTLAGRLGRDSPDLVAKHSFMCIYSLINYGSGASQPQVLRVLNVWINRIPEVIASCKSLVEISPEPDGIKLLLDIVKLMRNKKIINSTKRYIPLILTLILKQVKLMDMESSDNSLIIMSIKRQLQLSLESCGPNIVQEWSYDMPNNLRIYLKQFDIRLSSYSKYKSP